MHYIYICEKSEKQREREGERQREREREKEREKERETERERQRETEREMGLPQILRHTCDQPPMLAIKSVAVREPLDGHKEHYRLLIVLLGAMASAEPLNKVASSDSASSFKSILSPEDDEEASPAAHDTSDALSPLS